MLTNKKNIIITATSVVAVLALGFGAFKFFSKDNTTDLPLVVENPNPVVMEVTPTPKPTPRDFTEVELPESDSNDENSFLIDESDIPEMTEEEIEEEIAYLEEFPDVELTIEEIKESNEKITEAIKEAEVNPDIVQLEIQPVEIDEYVEPVKDADGYIYTKEEAIAICKKTWEELIATNDFNYTDVLESAKRNDNFTQEKFDSDLQILLNDPYSSPSLTAWLDSFRKTGNLGTLIVGTGAWLLLDGDNAQLADRTN